MKFHQSFAWIACIALLSSSVFANVGMTGAQSIAPTLVEQSRQAASRVASDSGAEVLLHKILAEVGDDQLKSSVIYLSIRISDKTSVRDYSNIQISFDNHYSELELDFANTLSSDGQLYPLSEEALQLRTTGGGQDFYSEESNLVFSLPQLDPGSLIEFQYRVRNVKKGVPGLVTDYIVPAWFQPTADNQRYRADPVQMFEYQQAVPAELSMKHQVSLPMPDPDVREVSGQRITRWSWQNPSIPALEDGMPPAYEVMPFISSSNQDDWQAFHRWANNNYLPSADMAEQVAPVIAQLGLTASATEMDKIQAVYRWMETNVRYVYAHLGRGGYTPHDPHETLRAGYGDCKDQTLLVLAMMQALGVEARPVLVRTGSRAPTDTSLVRNIFDHIFVYLPATETREAIWFDTTGENSLFPGASAGLQGQPALILGIDQAAELVQLDMKATNRAVVAMNYRLTSNKRLEMSARIDFEGISEQSFRNWYTYSSDREEGLRQYLGALYNDVGQYDLEYQVHNAEDLFNPIYMTAQFRFKHPIPDGENISMAGNARQMMQLFGVYGSFPDTENRQLPFLSNYDLSYQMKVKVEVPKGYESLIIEELESVDSPFFRLNASVQGDGAGLSMEGIFPEIRVPANSLAAFSQQIEDVYNRNDWRILLVHSSNEHQLAELNKIKQTEGEDSLGFHLAQAKQQLDQGKFSEALVSAKAAVTADQNSAEAWYLLGTAEGMNGDYDASDDAYKKAESLGYRY